MEINITRFFKTEAPMDYSASVAEIGRDAARDTWKAATENAPDYADLLDTEEKREAFKDQMRDAGFSEAGEMDDWTHEALTGLFMQLISGDMREAGLDGDSTNEDWARYEADDSCAHAIYRGDDGEVYYYLGN
jgi:hypothetical protein